MDESDDAATLLNTGTEAEIKELLGLFDAPAFVRRGQDVEYAVARLHARCRREREQLLEMVRLRLRQWAGVATGPEDVAGTFAPAAPIAELGTLAGAESLAWAAHRAPPRRRRAVARDLVASVSRFNRRWSAFLDQLNLEPVNRMVEAYNRYYLLEKECVLGSSRLAMRHYTPRDAMSRAELDSTYPELPLPEFLP
jgi:hypothetical protein